MIWPILFVSAFLILMVSTWRKQKDFFSVDYVPWVGAAVGSFLLGGLGMCFALGVGHFLPRHWEKTETTKLTMLFCYSCDDNYPFLVVNEGRNGGNIQYYHYKRDGLYVETLVATGNAMVFESFRTDGMLEVFEYRFTEPWFHWITFEQKDDNKKKYEFLIPRRSNFVFE